MCLGSWKPEQGWWGNEERTDTPIHVQKSWDQLGVCSRWWRAPTTTSNPEPEAFLLEDYVRAVSGVAKFSGASLCSCSLRSPGRALPALLVLAQIRNGFAYFPWAQGLGFCQYGTPVSQSFFGSLQLLYIKCAFFSFISHKLVWKAKSTSI